MKKFVLLSATLIYSLAFAQTDDPGCNLNVSQKMGFCDGNATCATTTNCATVNFTVVCSNTYWVKAWTACESTNCAHCASCVEIRNNSGVVFSISTEQFCPSPSTTCCDTNAWTPSPGNYTLKVCLVPCNEGDEETCCHEGHGCYAWGQVSSQPLSCP